MIGKGTQRTIPLDLLGAIAGALAAAGNAPKTLAMVRELIGQDEHPTRHERMTMNWQPIETAPKDRSVMLYTVYGLIDCGRRRFGNLGEPQRQCLEWRCDSSGRFANPTHWMPLPPPPTQEPP